MILDFNGAFYHIESIEWRNFVAMASRNILASETQANMIEKHKGARISSANDSNDPKKLSSGRITCGCGRPLAGNAFQHFLLLEWRNGPTTMKMYF